MLPFCIRTLTQINVDQRWSILISVYQPWSTLATWLYRYVQHSSTTLLNIDNSPLQPLPSWLEPCQIRRSRISVDQHRRRCHQSYNHTILLCQQTGHIYVHRNRWHCHPIGHIFINIDSTSIKADHIFIILDIRRSTSTALSWKLSMVIKLDILLSTWRDCPKRCPDCHQIEQTLIDIDGIAVIIPFKSTELPSKMTALSLNRTHFYHHRRHCHESWRDSTSWWNYIQTWQSPNPKFSIRFSRQRSSKPIDVGHHVHRFVSWNVHDTFMKLVQNVWRNFRDNFHDICCESLTRITSRRCHHSSASKLHYNCINCDETFTQVAYKAINQ